MSYKSSSLNLWDVETKSTKLDIDVSATEVKVQTTGSQTIKFTPVVAIGAVSDVAQKFADTDASIASGNAGSAAASALVQQNLNAYESSNNASVATISATVTANKATADAQHAADASARATLQTDLETKITSEETDRKSADATLTAGLSQEVSDRQSAVVSEASVRASADTSLSSEISVERGRIDGILNGSTVDLDSLKEIVDAFTQASGDTLAVVTSLQSQVTALTQRVDQLTGDTQTPSYDIRPLQSVVSELDMTSGSSFLTGKNFQLTYDMTDRWSATTSAMVGWATVKSETIAVSGGVLTGSSTDSEVKAFIEAGLTAVYGSNYAGSADAAQLSYMDPEHYCLRVGLVAGTKPVFKSASQSSLSDITWEVCYCTTAGDISTRYSTILSGTSAGSVLSIVPTVAGSGVEFPVSGIGGVRDGVKSTIDSLTIQ